MTEDPDVLSSKELLRLRDSMRFPTLWSVATAGDPRPVTLICSRTLECLIHMAENGIRPRQEPDLASLIGMPKERT
jgi:hypothetical protein